MIDSSPEFAAKLPSEHDLGPRQRPPGWPRHERRARVTDQPVRLGVAHMPEWESGTGRGNASPQRRPTFTATHCSLIVLGIGRKKKRNNKRGGQGQDGQAFVPVLCSSSCPLFPVVHANPCGSPQLNPRIHPSCARVQTMSTLVSGVPVCVLRVGVFIKLGLTTRYHSSSFYLLPVSEAALGCLRLPVCF